MLRGTTVQGITDLLQSHQLYLDLIPVSSSDVGNSPASFLFYALLMTATQEVQEAGQRIKVDDELEIFLSNFQMWSDRNYIQQIIN